MRRFICTADIHLWLRKEAPDAWQIHRYMMLFELLIKLCQDHQASLIVAGDLFEKAEPDLEEQQLALLFFRMLREAGIEVFAITGNHETLGPGRDTFQHLDMGYLKTVKAHYGKNRKLYMPEEDCSIHFVNHCDLGTYQGPGDTTTKLNILVSHFRCNYTQFVKEELDVERLLLPFDLCIAGDIHAPYGLGKLIYTNNPVNKEFQGTVDTGVVLLTVDKGTCMYERIPTHLPALIQVNLRADEDLPELNDTDFYRVEVTGTVPELKQVSVVLPNVKLVKVPEAVEVLVTGEEPEELKVVSHEEELIAYMQELGYSDEKITRMMTVYKEAA